MKGEKSLWIFRGFFGCYDKSDTAGDSQSFVNLVRIFEHGSESYFRLVVLAEILGTAIHPDCQKLGQV